MFNDALFRFKYEYEYATLYPNVTFIDQKQRERKEVQVTFFFKEQRSRVKKTFDQIIYQNIYYNFFLNIMRGKLGLDQHFNLFKFNLMIYFAQLN